MEPSARFPNRSSRRELLGWTGMSLAGVALDSMIGRDLLAETSAGPHGPDPAGRPHLPARAKSVIWLFMPGSPSQVDTFDYKPELQKRNGEKLEGADPKTGFFTTNGKILGSPFSRRPGWAVAPWP